MWISKAAQKEIEALRAESSNWRADYAAAAAKLHEIEKHNERLANDVEWFKMRLNQLERERAALLRTATGARIEVPEFLPSFNPQDAVQPDQDMFRGVGDDDPDDKAPLVAPVAVSHEAMPRRARN